MRNIHSFVAIWVLLAVLVPIIASAESRVPVKIAVDADRSQLLLGNMAAARVVIQDALNKPVAASRSITINLEAVFASGRTERKQIVIEKGMNEAEARFMLKEAGAVQIRASHDQLLDGETLLIVQLPKPVRVSSQKSKPIAPIVSQQPVLTRVPKDVAVPLGGGRYPTMAGSPATKPSARPPPAKLDKVVQSTRLTLYAAPQRTILADEMDEAKIYAYLDHEAERDTEVRLSASLGSLASVPIRIKKGEVVGESRYTSKDIGLAEVVYQSATPTVEFDGDELEIHFGPPIHKIELVSPSKISLVETPNLVVKLSDHNGVPQNTERERTVILTLNGPGKLTTAEIVIPKDRASSSTSLRPTGLGTITLEASTAGLIPQEAKLEVSFPWLVLILCLLGGAAGGWTAMLTQKPARRVRILVGVVTGVVIYWVFVFGLVDVPPGAAVHPLGAFSIPTLGGFMGTQAFTWILNRFGIQV